MGWWGTFPSQPTMHSSEMQLDTKEQQESLRHNSFRRVHHSSAEETPQEPHRSLVFGAAVRVGVGDIGGMSHADRLTLCRRRVSIRWLSGPRQDVAMTLQGGRATTGRREQGA